MYVFSLKATGVESKLDSLTQTFMQVLALNYDVLTVFRFKSHLMLFKISNNARVVCLCAHPKICARFDLNTALPLK